MIESNQFRKISISTSDFHKFQKLIFEVAGISLSEGKKDLVEGRLSKRLRALNFSGFGEYFDFVMSHKNSSEFQTVIDLLTTNETYFFRESDHFILLKEIASSSLNKGRSYDKFRVWSAASSSGEEAYTIAMTLAEILGDSNWEVLGTDISTKVLAAAKNGHYSIDRSKGISKHLLKKYCLKGVDDEEGTFLIKKELKKRVDFLHCNLMNIDKKVGIFDAIFLRNVMIYFEADTKMRVISNILPHLKIGGYLFIGHSESINGWKSELAMQKATVYKKK